MRLLQPQVVATAPNVTVKVGLGAALAAPAEAPTSATASEAAPSFQSAPGLESVAQYEHKVWSLLGLCYVSALRKSVERLHALMHELSLLQIRECLRVVCIAGAPHTARACAPAHCPLQDTAAGVLQLPLLPLSNASFERAWRTACDEMMQARQDPNRRHDCKDVRQFAGLTRRGDGSVHAFSSMTCRMTYEACRR
jgi:hypothetical protein